MSGKKIVKYGALGVLLALLTTWSYLAFLTLRDFESLLLCSQGRDEWIPKSVCQTYLINFRGTRDDMALLDQTVGVGWALHAEHLSDREKLLDFLLKKGANIDGIDPRSGITALHAAVLENNAENVRLLLSRHANTQIQSADGGQTPLQLALALSSKPNQQDRSGVIALLKK